MIVASLKTLNKFALDHWRGHIPLPLTIIFSLLLIRALIWLISNPFETIWLTSLLIILNVIVLLWQIIGTIRSGDKYLKSDGSGILVMASYFVIVGACYATALQIADWLSGDEPIKISEESLRTRPLPNLSNDKTILYLEGVIDFELNTSARFMFKEHPTINTITLNSEGGAIYAARAIANAIIENGLDTHIDAVCNSACTIIFMAGHKRSIGTKGKIGFHQYKDDQANPLNTNETKIEQEKDIAYFKNRGVSDPFLDALFQAKHSEIWIPDLETLKRSGIINSN